MSKIREHLYIIRNSKSIHFLDNLFVNHWIVFLSSNGVRLLMFSSLFSFGLVVTSTRQSLHKKSTNNKWQNQRTIQTTTKIKRHIEMGLKNLNVMLKFLYVVLTQSLEEISDMLIRELLVSWFWRRSFARSRFWCSRFWWRFLVNATTVALHWLYNIDARLAKLC